MKNTLSTRRLIRKTLKKTIADPSSDSAGHLLDALGLSQRTEPVPTQGHRVVLTSVDGQVWEAIALTASWALALALCEVIGSMSTQFWARRVNEAFTLLTARSAQSPLNHSAYLFLSRIAPAEAKEL